MRMWSTILITNTWRDLPPGLLQCSWTNYGSIFHWISYPFQEISIKYDVVFVAIDRLSKCAISIWYTLSYSKTTEIREMARLFY